jgi:hypothetical protein
MKYGASESFAEHTADEERLPGGGPGARRKGFRDEGGKAPSFCGCGASSQGSGSRRDGDACSRSMGAEVNKAKDNHHGAKSVRSAVVRADWDTGRNVPGRGVELKAQ